MGLRRNRIQAGNNYATALFFDTDLISSRSRGVQIVNVEPSN
jgi:hypothetical protein